MKSPCQVCKHQNGRLRCSRCHSAYYCSVKCQRLDWKKGNHAKVCQAFVEFKEHELLQSRDAIPISVLHEEHNKALHMIRLIENEQNKAANKLKNTKIPSPDKRHATAIATRTVTTVPHFNRLHTIKSNWSFTMELLPRLSCYQLIIKRPPRIKHSQRTTFLPQIRTVPPNGALQILLSTKTQTTITIQNLPFPIMQDQARIHAMEDTNPTHLVRYWIVTLPYDNLDATNPANEAFHPPNTIFDAMIATDQDSPHYLAKNISCNACFEPLVANPDAITALSPAPSDRWDELQDYIACGTQENAYSLFGKAMQQRDDIILYDATSLSFSSDQPINACVLSLPNYYGVAASAPEERANSSGENNALATMVDELSGTVPRTLTCRCCAMTLGSATASQQRLLLHRIALGTARLSSISRFVVQIMMEQAESKAVYALRVVCEGDDNKSVNRSLILRLVSWDSFSIVAGSTTAAQVGELHALLDTSTTQHDLCLPNETLDATSVRQTVKLLFTAESSSSRHENPSQEQPATLNWTQWTRFDPCCSPDANVAEDNMTLSNAVLPCLGLDDDEFRRLQFELEEASVLIPDEVVHAAVAAKLQFTEDTTDTQMAAILV